MRNKNLGRCQEKKCPFEHSIKKWETKTGKTAKIVEKKAGGQSGGQNGQSGGGNDWDKPVGLNGGQRAVLVGKTGGVTANSGLQVPSPNGLKRLGELPVNCWKEVDNELQGTQYLTRFGIGKRTEVVMLDGGSGVNSITEDTVVAILNEQKAAGISLSDKQHPVKQLEHWKQREELRGVAGGKTVPLIGAVVLEMQLLEVGKPKTHSCQTILVRFKICASGATDWAPTIIGARAIDCVERGGLGFVPGPRPHFMGAYGILMERVEDEYKDLSRAEAYCIKHSILDSSDDEDYGIMKVANVSAAASKSTLPGGTTLIFEGEGRMVEPEEMLWIPVRMESSPEHRSEDVQLALPSDLTPLEAVPGLWPTGATEGMICIWNLTELPVPLETGGVAAEVLPGVCFHDSMRSMR